MQSIKTDLAIELKEFYSEDIDGVITEESKAGCLTIYKVEIKNDIASKKIGKSKGAYYTIDMPYFGNKNPINEEEIEIVADKISRFLPNSDSLILVVGLGNMDITPDSLGPKTVHNLISTRHVKLDDNVKEQFEQLRAVASISPGVLGQTGIETSEFIYGVTKQISPAAVIVIDALVSRDIRRLGSTIQISNTGISPGAGVMNKRKGIDSELLGIPVISIGIPTVVDATTLVENMVSIDVNNKHIVKEFKNKIEPFGSSLIVTPKEVDMIIGNSSYILGLIINKSLHKNLSLNEIISILS